METDHYKVLNMSRDATESQIRTAYRDAAREWHPDVNDDPLAPGIMAALNEANDTLIDPVRRAEYDSLLSEIDPQQTITDSDMDHLIESAAAIAAEELADGASRRDALEEEGYPRELSVQVVNRLVEIQREARREEATPEIVWGLVIAGAGAGLSWATYSAASGGSTYFVFWGLIAYGGYRLIRGLSRLGD